MQKHVFSVLAHCLLKRQNNKVKESIKLNAAHISILHVWLDVYIHLLHQCDMINYYKFSL